jgi:hypothetical protein
MNRLVALVMLLTLAALAAEIVEARNPWWLSWSSLALALFGTALTLTRTVRDAKRLGMAADPPDIQSGLAHSIYRDHAFAFARTTLLLILQLIAQ